MTNFVFGCAGGAPDTLLKTLSEWSEHPNVFFSAGHYLLGDEEMLYTRHVIGPFQRAECTTAAKRKKNYQLARLQVKS